MSRTARRHHEDINNLDRICEVLDKVYVETLILMQQHIDLQLKLEQAMILGEGHLAKTRYISGHGSVSALQIPKGGEGGDREYNALTTVVIEKNIPSDEHTQQGTVPEDATVRSLHVQPPQSTSSSQSNNGCYTDPLRWFGYLVPTDLREAQSAYRQALKWAVAVVNVDRRMRDMQKYGGILERRIRVLRVERQSQQQQQLQGIDTVLNMQGLRLEDKEENRRVEEDGLDVRPVTLSETVRKRKRHKKARHKP